MVGGLSVGAAAAFFGRKRSLLLNNAFVFVGGCMMATAKYADTYTLLIAGRFFIGVSAGFAAGLTPMYLSEISPASVRGAVGTVYQV
jgi:predicted MFS family arabinose efflux permease